MRKLIAPIFAVALAISLGADKDNKLPAALDGFSGTVEGTIVTVGENHKAVTLKIDKILHKNASSTAANPDGAIGKTVLISAKPSADKGKPDAQQVAFIKTLKKGEDLQLDVAEAGGKLLIDELTAAQKDTAAK